MTNSVPTARERAVRKVFTAALAYFAWVFGAGFALGLVRVPLIVPRLGVRWSELAEMPLMLGVIAFAARWVVRRHRLHARPADCVAVGLAALALLLASEFGLALWLQDLTPSAWLASRDPVSGPVYALMLVVYALMPFFMARTTTE